MKAVSTALFAGVMGFIFVQPISATERATYTEKVLYSFCSQPNCADGAYPATLIDVNGTLYGTTEEGGLANCSPFTGCGTVFSLDLGNGAEKVLYAFCKKKNCADGLYPSSLTDLGSTLYGTTFFGGTSEATCADTWACGIAFAVNPTTGKEKVIYTFCTKFVNGACSNGAGPQGAQLDVKGALYGATQGGGAGQYGSMGMLYALNPKTGTQKVLYTFCSQPHCDDGFNPVGGLIDVNGMLYGSTLQGGGLGCTYIDPPGCGTVFALDPKTGAEKVLHSFPANATDGSDPDSGLIDVNAMLYGTTEAGGNPGCYANYGCGTLFSVDPNTGAEKVLYAFCSQPNCADGADPYGLIKVKGTLYGTTQNGGGSGCNGSGCGTVFSIDPNTGAETVLYSFCSQPNCVDGANPYGLIAVNGTLYGTTSAGGSNGDGTVFALTKR